MAATGCSWLQLAATGCSWQLLLAAGCWLLAAGCCWAQDTTLSSHGHQTIFVNRDSMMLLCYLLFSMIFIWFPYVSLWLPSDFNMISSWCPLNVNLIYYWNHMISCGIPMMSYGNKMISFGHHIWNIILCPMDRHRISIGMHTISIGSCIFIKLKRMLLL